ncbi:hypothetical protein H8784_13320 [Parabacteroides acidifaciens]|uniref:Nuclear transport factor 2 family protein n=1 Tax=Parabacteroides acidifaciens TaxID=2290935 RepID=A0A3D8HC94_9BACT|nr:hypothetical protein [Parabacteroides acidifaciens]MBC8602692.1 hypothetical protein [Parabacteroides acidifaciens]RDU48586.1 hypothetical protein DWU89_13680 [Parabacteroides acidifaciens]
MKTKISYILISIVCMLMLNMPKGIAVTVTLTVDEYTDRPAALNNAANNLAIILTEINRAQQAKSILTTKHLPMDEFSLKSLLRLWAVTPFYCDDEEVVDRCWVFKDGTMMVSHIPLIITPENENFGVGAYQEAVVEFDPKGNITDFRLALDAHTAESMERCGSVVEKEKQMIIMQYIERFRTAYNQRDSNYIEKIFSDDALIITGKVVITRTHSDLGKMRQKVEYTKQTKEQYIRNLKKAFKRNKWIDVKFSEIGEYGESGGCAGITRSTIDPTKYGVRLRQEWNSSNYSDKGYLFLLWEFPEDGKDPIIHVRTWQPEWVGGTLQQPDDNISTLGAFDL